MTLPSFLLLTASLYLLLVRADYTIDDSNYSVLKFSENPSGPVWGPFGSDTGEVLEIRLPNGTMQTVNAVPCYDGTYTYAACSSSDNCAVQFSFTGSGLTIYVLQAGPQGMTASLSIDSGTATTATLGAPPPPQYYISRVPLFDVQNIPSGAHSAVMTVQDWNGGFSGMMLDYINVNQATVNPTTSSSPSPSSTPSSTPAQSSSPTPSASSGPITAQTGQATSSATTQASTITAAVSIASEFSSQVTTAFSSSTSSGNGTSPTGTSELSGSSKQTNVATAVGGGVGGGVALLALVGLALFCCVRRRRLRQEQMLNERPRPLFSPAAEAAFTSPDRGGDPFGSSAVVSVIPPATTRELSASSPAANVSHTRVSSSGDLSVASSAPVSIGVVAATATATSQDRDQSAVRSGVTPSPASYPIEKSRATLGAPAAPDQDPTHAPPANAAPLTDEQADFVNSLFNNNVPAPVVARVLERMLANPQGATGINDPELHGHFGPGNPGRWSSTLSDIADGETTMGTAPPSYDYARAQ